MIVYRTADGRNERFPALATDLLEFDLNRRGTAGHGGSPECEWNCSCPHDSDCRRTANCEYAPNRAAWSLLPTRQEQPNWLGTGQNERCRA